ncbi:MAG: hypothetical protein K6G57_05205 [Lachnospiraceae bacterium]|nr:hypothetical protein [Lachnospiraceae bacterium]
MEQSFREKLEEFITGNSDIRELSMPQIQSMHSADDYRGLLQENFLKIGEIAARNRAMLAETLYPMLDSGEKLTDDQIEALEAFTGSITDPGKFENIDLTLLDKVADRLLQDARAKEDTDYLVNQLFLKIVSSYAIVAQVNRLFVSDDLSKPHQKEGLAAAEELLAFLNKDIFAGLSENSRNTVLEGSRYYTALYETTYADEESSTANLEALKKSYDLAEDPFYPNLTPGYDWYYHKIRTLSSMADCLECGNIHGFSAEQCEKIYSATQRLEKLWKENVAQGASHISESELKLYIARSSYYAEKINLTEYREKLLEIYEARTVSAYDDVAVRMNLMIPLEYLVTFGGDKPGEREYDTLEYLYRGITSYALNAPTGADHPQILNCFARILDFFIEIPGGMTFEELGLDCMAALHQPTYVHSLLVAKLSRCLCTYMIEEHPEYFLGFEDCETIGDVRAKKNLIISDAFHAGLCYDFGKLMMIDTIHIYGRGLFDSEFELLRLHPVMGAEMLSRYPSTDKFANVAWGHHRWYNHQGGYPEEFDAVGLPERVLIDIVAVADCLDAATESVGRSYSKSKSAEDVIGELAAGSGTRYAPYIVNLFVREDVRKDVIYLLQEGRRQNYRNTYVRLRDVRK